MAVGVDELVSWMLGKNRYFYHFTDTRNLPSIDQFGLLPMSRLRQSGIAPVTGGNATSLSIDATKGYDKFVHLCFRSSHPMAYAACKEGRIAEARFLKISPNVLKESGVLVSDMIVTANQATLGPPSEMLAKLDLEILYKTLDWKIPEVRDRLKIAEKYEILVPNYVKREFIIGL
ncbi:DarT ssDNA thymidine ADP-ribosyltransferase family protein [Novosphingobium sp. SG720]|uniref:DarT ssDNA thymidine ADP-ribosyltransferase family protein n=1 Tax=Novosphingobium sp. SG720 TaxID=2586998 RepID=UPI0014467A21|nr:DarT ssDNA thymidine ADP-ribosyltransferase family protein [Novosphingobium sp. SG720]NKJ43178.1 hypothetical protein [Novosphingobium sp. SG720]